jgi:hypothetical protein
MTTTKITKHPRPMKATKANVTRVLTAAGYSKWSYHGMRLTPGPSVENGTDIKTGQAVLFVFHRRVFGCVSQDLGEWLKDRSNGFYCAAYARALRKRFKVSCRVVSKDIRQGKVWVIEPLDTGAGEGDVDGN